MKFYYKTDQSTGSGNTQETPVSTTNPKSKLNLSWLPWVLGVIAAVLVFKPGLLKKLNLKKLNPFAKKAS